MLKINKHASVTISFILAIIAFVCVIAVAVLLPFLDWEHIATEHAVVFAYPLVIALLYAMLVPAAVADIALLRLLGDVRHAQVFTAQSVAKIRLISWCCFAEVALLLVLGVCFPLVIAVAFAAAFLGVVLRVVKNVIEEAVDIKAENDFTV